MAFAAKRPLEVWDGWHSDTAALRSTVSDVELKRQTGVRPGVGGESEEKEAATETRACHLGSARRANSIVPRILDC